MRGTVSNLTDSRFGMWTVIGRHGTNKHNRSTWKCLCECGKEVVVAEPSLSSGKSRSCGCARRLKASIRARKTGPGAITWAGGRTIDRTGYVRLRIPNENRPSRSRYVLEHRFVMERHLGRRLLPNETVHHINGIKHDNRLENLELWSSSHPSGQRREDLVYWAKDILRQYEPSALAGEVAIGRQ